MALPRLLFLLGATSVGGTASPNEMLCDAAASGNVHGVVEALRQGADVNGNGDPVSRVALRITSPRVDLSPSLFSKGACRSFWAFKVHEYYVHCCERSVRPLAHSPSTWHLSKVGS